MKKFISLMACAAILGLGFTSCDDDDDYKINPDAIGDAYIKTVKIGDEVKHGLVLYAYTNVNIESAKVVTPDINADTVTLESFNEATTIFRSYPTEEADFSTELPTAGKYNFIIKSEDGDILNRTDELTEDVIDVIEISEFTPEENEITVKWTKVENADKYLVRLYNNKEELIYSLYLKNTDVEFILSDNKQGWMYSNVGISDVKKLKLTAIQFESSVSPNEYAVQSISEDVRVIE